MLEVALHDTPEKLKIRHILICCVYIQDCIYTHLGDSL